MNNWVNDIFQDEDSFSGARLATGGSSGLQNFQANVPQSKPDITQGLDLTFQVKRLTANITKDLPFVLGAAYHLSSDYQTLMFPNAPGTLINNVDLEHIFSGAEDGSLVNGDGKLIKFVYKDGANVDIVELSCAESPILPLIERMKNSRLLFTGFKLIINSTGSLAQRSKPHYEIGRDMFGTAKQRAITLTKYKTESDYVDTIISANFSNAPKTLSGDEGFGFDLAAVAGLDLSLVVSFAAGKSI